MQVICTPLHLLALNLVNAPGATVSARLSALAASGPAAGPYLKMILSSTGKPLRFQAEYLMWFLGQTASEPPRK
jgi:hypothetical protein